MMVRKYGLGYSTRTEAFIYWERHAYKLSARHDIASVGPSASGFVRADTTVARIFLHVIQLDPMATR